MASKKILTAHTVASAGYWKHAKKRQATESSEPNFQKRDKGASCSLAGNPNLCQIHQPQFLTQCVAAWV